MKGRKLMFNATREDVQIQCAECGKTFVFTVDDQEYHEQKGYSAPKRCMECRQKRRMDRRQSRQMHKVICNACGCETEVPFKPMNNKPVYCNECFQKKKDEEN